MFPKSLAPSITARNPPYQTIKPVVIADISSTTAIKMELYQTVLIQAFLCFSFIINVFFWFGSGRELRVPPKSMTKVQKQNLIFGRFWGPQDLRGPVTTFLFNDQGTTFWKVKPKVNV